MWTLRHGQEGSAEGRGLVGRGGVTGSPLQCCSTSVDGVSCRSSGSGVGQATAWAQGPVMNGRARHRARCLRTGRGGPWGGRARVGGRGWAGPRGAARPERSGRRTRRDQEVAALCPRPEVSGAAPGEGVREVPASSPALGQRGLRLAVPAARGKREAPPLGHLWIGSRHEPEGCKSRSPRPKSPNRWPGRGRYLPGTSLT